jgi:hypothetical protein
MRHGLLLMTFSVALVGCTNTKEIAGPPVVAKVAVPVACEIEQVPASQRLTAPKGSGIFDLTKTALSDRRRLMAENTRLRAANNNPCPGAAK